MVRLAPVCQFMKEEVCRSDSPIECNPPLDLCALECPDTFRCSNGACHRRSIICDGRIERSCDDDIEHYSGIGFKCERGGTVCIIPQSFVYDQIRDCDDGEDICFEVERLV